MPRKDPITGCMVMTAAEFFADEAEREGKGRTGGELLSEMMQDIADEEGNEVKRLLSNPPDLVQMFQEAFNANEELADDPHEDVEAVLQVLAARVHYGMRETSVKILAQVQVAVERVLYCFYSSYDYSGSFYEPPDYELLVDSYATLEEVPQDQRIDLPPTPVVIETF
jgi:hypothetical protein